MSKISEQTALTVTPASGDLLTIVDVSDSTQASSGTTKKIAASVLGLDAKRYVALLTQTSTNAPVATVLENTLGGTVVWGYTSAGVYTATLTGAFTSAKTVVFCNRGANAAAVVKWTHTSADVLTFESTGDNTITNGAFEIRVYP